VAEVCSWSSEGEVGGNEQIRIFFSQIHIFPENNRNEVPRKFLKLDGFYLISESCLI